MTSDRQLEANRRNAARSTGPRSRAGKGRSSKNALRHGFSTAEQRQIHQEEIEQLTRELAGDQIDSKHRISARRLACAAINLERAAQYKLSLIRRALLVGRVNRSYVASQLDPIVWTAREMRQVDRVLNHGGRMPRLRRLKPLPPLPSDERPRLSEAFQRVLPEIEMIERYERAFLAGFTEALITMPL